MNSIIGNIIGWILVLVITCIGWIINWRNSEKARKDAAAIAKEEAKRHTELLEEVIKTLPCVQAVETNKLKELLKKLAE